MENILGSSFSSNISVRPNLAKKFEDFYESPNLRLTSGKGGMFCYRKNTQNFPQRSNIFIKEEVLPASLSSLVTEQ